MTEEDGINGEYDEDEYEYENLERTIYAEYSNPYIVQVAYDLNKSDAEDIKQRNLD